MHAERDETALLAFCELLNRWRSTHQPSDLETALAAIVVATYCGRSATAESMCRAMYVVTGVRATVAAANDSERGELH